MNKYRIAAVMFIVIVAAVTLLGYVLSNQSQVSGGSMITATRTVTVMSSENSYTTTTTQVTITGTTCDNLFANYQGGKEYKAWGLVYSYIQLDQQSFMNAVNYYRVNSYGGQRILYRGELEIVVPNSTYIDHPGPVGYGWNDALYFFDNGEIIVYPCP